VFDYLHTPYYVDLLFVLTVLTTLYLFYIATRGSKAALLVCIGWLLLQSVVSITGFYSDTLAMPPRFPLLVIPPVLLIVYLFASRSGRKFIDSLDLRMLTQLHIVRALVEVVLWRLCIETYIPKSMTFEGQNFDILSGVSAPIVAYFAFHRLPVKRTLLLVWNVICLALVLNVVTTGALSAPSPFQKFAFDQPNIAVLYFPFALLPALVVPVVIFSHLAALRKLLLRIP
jgi:hypothetical protein